MEEKNEELIELLNALGFIQKTYEVMRIVDPINKKILSYKKNQIEETGQSCHSFWENGGSCDNCVSYRALKENDTFIKLEYSKDKVYMVLAIPVVLKKKSVVIELLKDVTNNMLVVNKEKGEIEVNVHSIINNTGDLLLKDHLTGLFNRRYIDERLQVDIFNNSLHKQTLSLIMADIDFFKRINDNYGHLAGDYILKEIAKIIVSCVRDGKDWVGRYGGEEFLISLPDTNSEIVQKIAERMRGKIEDKLFEYDGQIMKLTMSFGAYTMRSETETSIESIIDFADRNLLHAKQNGRNMVISS